MATATRQKRSRDEDQADAQPSAPDEPILDALREGHALQRDGVLLPLAAQADFEACSEFSGSSSIGYLLTLKEQLTAFFPTNVRRESSATPLLPEWGAVKLLPPASYRIVFELHTTPGRYRAVAESRLSLDGYPAASRSPTDAERQAGFASQKALRLLLYPHALRFFHLGLHDVLRVEGAWPSARQVMMRGFELDAEVRGALDGKIAALSDSASAWVVDLRAMLRERHWPRARVYETVEVGTMVMLTGDTVGVVGEPSGRESPVVDAEVLNPNLIAMNDDFY